MKVRAAFIRSVRLDHCMSYQLFARTSWDFFRSLSRSTCACWCPIDRSRIGWKGWVGPNLGRIKILGTIKSLDAVVALNEKSGRNVSRPLHDSQKETTVVSFSLSHCHRVLSYCVQFPCTIDTCTYSVVGRPTTSTVQISVQVHDITALCCFCMFVLCTVVHVLCTVVHVLLYRYEHVWPHVRTLDLHARATNEDHRAPAAAK